MAAWTDGVRKIAAKLEVQWSGTTWTDESAYLISAQGGSPVVQPVWVTTGAVSVSPGQVTLTMMAADGRYSPFNSGGPLYSSISPTHGYGTRLRLSVGLWGGSSYTDEYIFTGRIDAMMTANAATGQVTIRAMDDSAWLQQARQSEPLTRDRDAGAYISQIALAAGITATDIDPGLCLIPDLWLDDEAAFNEMCLLGQAEAGYVMLTRAGTLVFENAETWATKTSAHSFTVGAFKTLSFTSSWQSIYNRVVVGYADRALVASDDIFSLRKAQVISPGESVTIVAQHKPVYGSITYSVTVTDYSGTNMTSSVTATVTATGAQRTTVTFANSNTYYAAVVSVFTLRAMTLSGDDDHEVTRDAAGSALGDPATGTVKALRLNGNPYLQTEFQAAMLADMLRDRLQYPRAVFTVNSPGIPTLEPSNLVTLVEAETGINRTAFITGITWTLANGAYNAAYQLIDAADWYPAGTWFAFGSSTLNGTHKLFY